MKATVETTGQIWFFQKSVAFYFLKSAFWWSKDFYFDKVQFTNIVCFLCPTLGR